MEGGVAWALCTKCGKLADGSLCNDGGIHSPYTVYQFEKKPGRLVPSEEPGAGSFGKAYVCGAPQNYVYCRKEFSAGDEKSRKKSFLKEVEALSLVQQGHPHIPRLYCIANGDVPVIVTYPWCRTSFSKFWHPPFFGGLDFKEVSRRFYCMAGTVSFLHNAKIAHRDIKDTNIKYHNGSFMLLDFGAAKKFDTNQQNTFWYSIPYVCPDHKPSKKSDVFVLGLVFVKALWHYFSNTELLNIDVFFSLCINRQWTDLVLQKLKSNLLNLCVGPNAQRVANVIISMLEIDLERRVSALEVTVEMKKIGGTPVCECVPFVPSAPTDDFDFLDKEDMFSAKVSPQQRMEQLDDELKQMEEDFERRRRILEQRKREILAEKEECAKELNKDSSGGQKDNKDSSGGQKDMDTGEY